MPANEMTDNLPVVHWEIKDVQQALYDLRGPGAFVPTRITASVGEKVALSCRVPDYPKRIPVVCTVTSRRLPRGGNQQLRAGLVLKVMPRDASHVRLLEDVASKKVVDLQQSAPRRWPELFSSFEDDQALRHAAERLLAGERLLMASRDAVRGDRISVIATAPGFRLRFNASARGVTVIDDARFVWIGLGGDRDEEVLREELDGAVAADLCDPVSSA